MALRSQTPHACTSYHVTSQGFDSLSYSMSCSNMFFLTLTRPTLFRTPSYTPVKNTSFIVIRQGLASKPEKIHNPPPHACTHLKGTQLSQWCTYCIAVCRVPYRGPIGLGHGCETAAGEISTAWDPTSVRTVCCILSARCTRRPTPEKLQPEVQALPPLSADLHSSHTMCLRL